MSIPLDARIAYRFVGDELFKLSLLRDRHVDAHIVSMQQSGTHWLRHMLALVICREFGLPEPASFDDRSIVGSHKHAVAHRQIPRIVSTHNIPSPLVHAAPLRWALHYPRYVILIRDIRATLVSYYEKHHAHEMPFSEMLRASRVVGKSVRWDLWRRIRFLNAWGRERSRLSPQRTIVVRYEDMQRETAGELSRVWSFLQLPPQSSAAFSDAVARSSKAHLAKQEDGRERPKIVHERKRSPLEWYSAEDRRYLTEVCARHLRHTFGYDYADWSTLGPSSPHIDHAAA
jgi:hypothetical protein